MKKYKYYLDSVNSCLLQEDPLIQIMNNKNLQETLLKHSTLDYQAISKISNRCSQVHEEFFPESNTLSKNSE